jgi:hypothetical protein
MQHFLIPVWVSRNETERVTPATNLEPALHA